MTTIEALSNGRPQADEHAPYFGRYTVRVPDGDIGSILRSQFSDTLALLRRTPETRGDFAYGPGKWTVKEVVGHLADTERVMGYRALTFARGDRGPLPSFDENAWVPGGNFGARSFVSLVDELAVVRAATIALVSGLDAGALVRRGVMNGHETSVRALLYIIAGHELHHLDLLRERYQLA